MDYKRVFVFSAALLFCCIAGPVSLRALEAKGAEKMSSKKYLVVYYSRTGNTKKVAQEVASRIGADIEPIIDKKKRNGFFGLLSLAKDGLFNKEAKIEDPLRNPADYDIVIIGTPVWGGDMSFAVKTYIKRYAPGFKDVAFIMTSGGSGPASVAVKMEQLCGKTSLGYIGFTGKERKDSAYCAKKIDDFVSSLKK